VDGERGHRVQLPRRRPPSVRVGAGRVPQPQTTGGLARRRRRTPRPTIRCCRSIHRPTRSTCDSVYGWAKVDTSLFANNVTDEAPVLPSGLPTRGTRAYRHHLAAQNRGNQRDVSILIRQSLTDCCSRATLEFERARGQATLRRSRTRLATGGKRPCLLLSNHASKLHSLGTNSLPMSARSSPRVSNLHR
jgi:hypothetical protein